ncbi:MAG: hypothetical protein L0L69_06155 [Propionibacterium sp.]|nr:hypothetical protein [Propionibacterium sp.]
MRDPLPFRSRSRQTGRPTRSPLEVDGHGSDGSRGGRGRRVRLLAAVVGVLAALGVAVPLWGLVPTGASAGPDGEPVSSAMASAQAPGATGVSASVSDPSSSSASVPASRSLTTRVAQTSVGSTSPECLLDRAGWGSNDSQDVPGVSLSPVLPGDRTFTSSDGVTSTYHVSTRGVDFSCQWGVMFWFEGDIDGHDVVSITDSQRLESLARVAARANLVLVVPDSPDRSDFFQTTWWEDYSGNARWFHDFATTLVDTWGVDTSQLWFTGFSGGAEFISTEVLAADQSWIGGGGAVMIGGGETSGVRDTPPAGMLSMPLTWFVGSEDGDIDSEDWSPLDIAPESREIYSRAGFTHTRLTVLPGVDHRVYDVAALVMSALKDAGRLD